MPAPTIDPDRRDPTNIAPTNSYHHADPVWVHRAGQWRAGIIETASTRAATVTYRPAGSRGTGVDTLTAEYLHPRADPDPQLDRTNTYQPRPAA
jgi:hypothetical protein